MKSVYSAVRTGSLNKAYWLRAAPPVYIQQLYALPTLYLCVLYLSENKQRLVPLIGFYNRDEKCLQRGTDWVYKYSSLRSISKGLNS